jgi:hypothetical protein
MRINKTLTIEHLDNRHIFLPNFGGEARQYNPAGKRNFNVCLDDPNAIYTYGDVIYDVGSDEVDENGHTPMDNLILDLRNDGWKPKILPPNEEHQFREKPILQVKINLNPPAGVIVPRIFLINNNMRATEIPEEDSEYWMNKIASSRIDWMNVTVTPSNYNYRDGGNDQSAYAAIMYFKLVDLNPWANRYDMD